VLAELLADERYHIEFNGYLSNHVKHALIALAGLGAPADRIQEYWDQYTSETPYGLQLQRAEKLSPEVSSSPLICITYCSLSGWSSMRCDGAVCPPLF